MSLTRLLSRPLSYTLSELFLGGDLVTPYLVSDFEAEAITDITQFEASSTIDVNTFEISGYQA